MKFHACMRRMAALTFVVGGSLLLSACSSTDSAYELMRQQQEQEAFLQSKEIEHWEKRKPDDKAMAVQMLQETQKQGRYFASLAYADAMHKEYGSDPEMRVLRAEALRQTGQLEQAAAAFQSLLDTSVSARAYQGLGLIAGSQQRFEAAAHYLSKAAAQDPTQAMLQSDLGYAYLRAGQPEQARLALGKAAELEPENGKILSNMALYLLVSGATQRAQFVMHQAGMDQQTQQAVAQMAMQIGQELEQMHAVRQREQLLAQARRSQAGTAVVGDSDQAQPTGAVVSRDGQAVGAQSAAASSTLLVNAGLNQPLLERLAPVSAH
ncbi:tetratricopeptide repeat protein [Alcaligenes sp. SDU_A2]|uniref:tetratricopeptide repeat protein n=1 Tax=Alcaligenes sp. SDU_A2 TaxID=3136634 RepID=UPI00311DF593